MYRDYLCHYGRKGMKWGQHIFTESDEERKRRVRVVNNIRDYAKYKNINISNYNDRYKNVNGTGVKIGKDYDVIEKGTEIYRVSTKKDEDYSKRIYASTSENDNLEYINSMYDGMLWGSFSSGVYNHTLESVSDLKVAHGKEVAKYLVDTYGSKDEQVAIKFLNATGNDKNNYPLRGYSNPKDNNYNYDKTDAEYAMAMRKTGYKFITKSMTNEVISNDVFNEFKKRGYDAIHDPEDNYLAGTYWDYPIILLNPQESVKTKHIEEW